MLWFAPILGDGHWNRVVWCRGFSLKGHPKGWTPNKFKAAGHAFAKDPEFVRIVIDAFR